MDFFEVAIYPFLFAAIYFQAFLLVTFLSKPAKVMRERPASINTPLVAMVVPCYNEERTAGGTAESLLALDYPKDRLKIVLVDDGSKDGTGAVLDSYARYENVIVIHQENGGKHAALNAGIAAVPNADIIGCLDADSFVAPDAMREIISCFDDPAVAAATPAMSVYKPTTMLERMQNVEFILGIALRHIVAAVNGLYVTPGPFSLYRRDIVVQLGGFKFGHQTEDMEMALRIQRAGFVIDNAPRARVYTKGMRSVPALVKQRTRWTSGFLRNVMFDYRDLVGNPKYGILGVIVLPLGFLAIIGGILIFFIAAYKAGTELYKLFTTISAAPLSYTLGNLIPSFERMEWFYMPFTLFMTLTLVSLGGAIALMLVGKRISKTPTSISAGLLPYVLVFGLIAPFWLMRSVADVATNTKRAWRW